MTLRVPRLPFTLDPLIGEAKRRARHRRLFIAAGLVLAAFAIGLTLGLRSGGGGPNGGLATVGASARVGPGLLRLSVPRDFRKYTVRGGSCNASTRLSAIGLLVTDYAVKNGVRGAFCKWSDFKVPPARRTALQVQSFIPFGPADPYIRLHLPLSLDQPWQIERARNGTTGYRYGAFRLHGQIYTVFVWNGPSAPARDRSALVRALGSIRPTR